MNKHIERMAYSKYMRENNIIPYSPIGILKRVTAGLLIGYGVVTFPIPTGSQVAIILGCSLLGISYKRVLVTGGHYGKKIWYVLKLAGDTKRFKYEVNVLKMRWKW